MPRTARSALVLCVLLIATAARAPLDAQQLPVSRDEAMRLLQQNPEAVRARIAQSGLSQDEIRARARAAGYPSGVLDEFLAGGAIDPEGASQALGALNALGVTVVQPDGLENVPVQTGMQTGSTSVDSTDSEELAVFGLDVFRRGTSRFQPLLSGPVPDDYRVGPGDQMVLILTGEVELAIDIEVTREGFIVIPDVGQVSVANLTMAELRTLVRSRLAPRYSGIERGETFVSLSITQLRTNQIYVTGEVSQPGAYQLASVATALNALYAAGGPTRLGNMRRVQVRRRNGEIRTLDLYPYLLDGDVSNDVTLEQGDAVFVPLRGRRVQLRGAVVRPAYYELAETDGLVDVLDAAGGFAPEAERRRISIHRVLRPDQRGPGLAERAAIDLELSASTDSMSANYTGGVTIPPVGLQDGDSIVVGSVPDLASGFYVSIAGMVRAPGRFPWSEDMTLRDLVELSRGPIVGADLRAAQVSRLPSERQDGRLADSLRVPLDSSYLRLSEQDEPYRGPPGVTFPPAGSAPDFALEPFDQVLIQQQPDFEMPQTVTITGEVSVPGEYTLLTKSDRVSGLVERAGGVLSTGYVDGARLIRRIDDLGRIDLDLATAMTSPGSDDDLVLQPSDSLYIPEYSPTVQVRGAVNSPVTVLYRAGEGLDYYIENAGGYRSDADEGRVSVRFANGQAETRSKFLFWSSYPTPGPGSEVVVPAEDPEDQFDTRGLITDLVAILGSITPVVVVLTR